MSGHVPKFGAPNAGNFTEVFTLARGGGKAGSGDSAASQPEESSNVRGAAAGRAGAPPRRVTAASESRDTVSNRSSQEGSLGSSNRPSPPARREPRDHSARGVRASQDAYSKPRSNPPRNMNEDLAGASHLPKFGEWNAGDGDTNYTVMFSAASKERKTGVAADDAPMKGTGDSHSNSSRLPKKQTSCWPCFS